MIDWLVFSINYGISCLSDLLVEETRVSGENHNLLYVTGKLCHLRLYQVYLTMGFIWFDLLCLTPLSAIFQLYHGDQF